MWFCASLGMILAVWFWHFSNSSLNRNDVKQIGSSANVEHPTANSALQPDIEIEALREMNRRLEEQTLFLSRQLEEARELARRAQDAAMKK